MAPCIKLSYRNQRSAGRSLRAIRALGDPRRRETSIYPCHACKGWHLTSKRVGGKWKEFQPPVG